MTSKKIETIESIWGQLSDLEHMSRECREPSLKPWAELVSSCIEAGALAPMVPSDKSGDLRLITAAPFLKCTLDDLRAMWLLVEIGYTTQAAAVAAVLFENALTTAVIAESEDLALHARKAKYAQIPWGAKDLCQLDAKREIRLGEKQGRETTQKMYEDNWTISYFHYKWLCQIKHPTWQTATHAIKSTIVTGTEYAVRPGPNTLPEDIHLGIRVVGISLTKALQAIKSYFLSLEGDKESNEYTAFEKRANKVHFGVLKYIKLEYEKPSPITVLDRSFIKTDFSTLRDRFGE